MALNPSQCRLSIGQQFSPDFTLCSLCQWFGLEVANELTEAVEEVNPIDRAERTD
jgi:hypothetical protein